MIARHSLSTFLAAALAYLAVACTHSTLAPLRVAANAPGPWPKLHAGQPLIIDKRNIDSLDF